MTTSENQPIDPGMYLDKLGITIIEASAERCVGEMPVEGNTQPDGFLHGGATCSLVETVGSIGAGIAAGWPGALVVGQQQTCNFLGTATSGVVRAVATPIHTGKTTHLWNIDVHSVDTGKIIAAARLTLAVRERRA